MAFISHIPTPQTRLRRHLQLELYIEIEIETFKVSVNFKNFVLKNPDSNFRHVSIYNLHMSCDFQFQVLAQPFNDMPQTTIVGIFA